MSRIIITIIIFILIKAKTIRDKIIKHNDVIIDQFKYYKIGL